VETTVQIRKIGNSNVYLDNIGLVPDLGKEGIETYIINNKNPTNLK
jgi:hypothetical protein